MAFDTAVNLARGKKFSEAVLDLARSRLPGGPAAQAAFDAALTLAKGKSIQDAAFAATGRLLPPSPYATDALAFAKKVAAGENIQRAALSPAGNAVLSKIERQTGHILARTNLQRKWPGRQHELPQMGLEQGEQESRPSPTKQKVRDTSTVPFRWLCKISIFKNGRYDSGGSGVLISDRHVLTAAHVVYDVIRDPTQFSLTVTLGLSGDQFPAAKKPDVSSQYKSGSLDHDYAIITLSHPISDKKFAQLGGNQLCFWGSSACGAGTTAVPVEPRNLVTQTAFTAGYPKNKGGNEMWSFSGLLASVPERSPLMVFTGDTMEGQSGSPVWVQQSGQFNLVGIVVARGNVNRALRLTWSVVAELNDWMLAAEKQAPKAPFRYELIQEVAAVRSPSNRFDQLVRAGQAAAAIIEAVRGGQTDINQLTNMLFYARHPELAGRKFRTDERALAQEWIQIRDTVVGPVLARLHGGPLSSTPTSSVATPAAPLVQRGNAPLFLGLDTYGHDGTRFGTG